MIATIDFETTGLKAGEDEVLQVSIIDENYNVLLNVYCRPNNKGSWEDAQAVHGITPLMVANELPFERYVPTVLDILSKADKVIAYNAAFEDSYLKAYGIEVDPEKWIDPMIMFAEIYGEWNERRGSYKWQSLTNPESQEAVDLNEERAKLTKTKRLNEELDLAVKKGELHRSEDIEKVMTAMLINFKSRLSAIPAEEADKLAAMTDKAKIFLYLNDKIKEALNELSDFEGMFKEEIKDEEGND